jgi:hypothetical protein
MKEAAEAFNTADLVWHNALVEIFGKDAGDMRYTSHGRGAEGTALRAAFDARCAAHDAWLASRNMGPARVRA